MTGIAQLYFDTTTSQGKYSSEGQYWNSRSGFGALFGRLSYFLDRLVVGLKVQGIGSSNWSHFTELASAPRHAYLLSELQDCDVGKPSLYPKEADWVGQVKGLVVCSLRTMWRWC